MDARPESQSTPNSIWNRGFSSLMLIQFAGAMNDNILRGTISYAVARDGIWSKTSIGVYGGTSLAALCLTVPFLLFSGWGGQVADRMSKSSQMIWLKLIELGCVLLAFLAFYDGSPLLALVSLFLIATQSAFFGPVKYGILIELVGRSRLGPANGWISMSTQIAIVLGAQLAGMIAGLYSPDGVHYDLVWLPGVFMVFFALLGLLPTFIIPRLPAIQPGLGFSLNPLSTYITAIKGMADGPVLRIALAWSGFWLVGAIALVAFPDLQTRLADPSWRLVFLPGTGNVVSFALVEVPGLDPVRAATLFSTLGIASGLGSVLCGLFSRRTIHPSHVPFGALGMTFFFLMFALAGFLPLEPKTLFWSWVVMAAGAGLSAGFYLIPLMTLIQKRAPDGERGRFLGTTNAISFTFMTLAAIIYLVWVKVLQLEPEHVFFLCAGLAAIGCIIFFLRRRHLAEWVQGS
ncbi:MAG: MFS transporter [Phycisphaerales bacterium]|nr:MFS transporter [Phycisphaerales bacterium]